MKWKIILKFYIDIFLMKLTYAHDWKFEKNSG